MQNTNYKCPYCGADSFAKRSSKQGKYTSWREVSYHTTVQEYFGSWNRALIASGFEPNYNSTFGIPTRGKDNVLYRSQAEAHFVDNHLYRKHLYIYEPQYSGNLWYYDFYLPDLDLYIEIDGHCRPERIKEKIEYNSKNNINCLVINTEDLYKQDFRLLI